MEAKYRLSGLKNYKESDELYMDISHHEYRTIAKITANALVREIFLFADQNRDGELNMKEVLLLFNLLCTFNRFFIHPVRTYICKNISLLFYTSSFCIGPKEEDRKLLY